MKLQQPWSRVLALALVGLPVGAGIWLVASWLYGTHAMLDAEIAQAQQLLSRYRTMVERRPEIEAAVAAYSRSEQSIYWSGSTEAVAAATLQRQLQRAIEADGTNVRRFQTLTPSRDDDYTAVNLRVTLDSSSESLVDTLYALENSRPYLFLDQLSIRAVTQRARAPQAVRGQNGALTSLQVNLDVRGYLDQRGGDQK